MPLFAKQKEYYEAFKSRKYKYLLYGGAMGGGKSILQIGIIHRLCIDYPGTRYAIVRKNLTTLKKTSIPSYEEVRNLNGHLELKLARFNRSDYTAYYRNESQIMFIEADITKDPDLNKLRGLELTGALIEEVNEVSFSAFNILKTRIGRWRNKDFGIRPFIMMNCNPDKNWVKEVFYDPWIDKKLEPPYFFLPALSINNPHLSEDYLEGLDDLPDEERQRFKEGNWELAESPNQLIKYLWIKESKNEVPLEELMKSRENRFSVSLGIDVARGGGDLTVFSYFVGSIQAKIEEFDIEDMEELAEIVKIRSDDYEIPPPKIGMDVIGPGGWGLHCACNKILKGNTIAFNSGEKPTDVPNDLMIYKNKRAQAHWEYREDIRKGNISPLNHKELTKQSTNINYSVDEKRLQIESKDAIKKRLGYSPDHLDATVIANHVRKMLSTPLPKFTKKEFKPQSSSLVY
jgi:hypothetical protein